MLLRAPHRDVLGQGDSETFVQSYQAQAFSCTDDEIFFVRFRYLGSDT